LVWETSIARDTQKDEWPERPTKENPMPPLF